MRGSMGADGRRVNGRLRSKITSGPRKSKYLVQSTQYSVHSTHFALGSCVSCACPSPADSCALPMPAALGIGGGGRPVTRSKISATFSDQDLVRRTFRTPDRGITIER